MLNTLKARINDPNKQLIKIFVRLIGLVVPALSDRELRQWSHIFINALVPGLNDKNDNNKREVRNTLNKFRDAIGKEDLLSALGPFLGGDKEGRLEVIAIIVENEEGIQKADTREYPKGIISCLTDRSK